MLICTSRDKLAYLQRPSFPGQAALMRFEDFDLSRSIRPRIVPFRAVDTQTGSLILPVIWLRTSHSSL